MEEEDPPAPAAVADLYFLIHKFLSGGPLAKTLQVFQEELEKNKILPQRTDWVGGTHESTIEHLEHQFPHIRPDYLLELCKRASTSEKSSSSDVNPLLSLKNSESKSNDYNYKQLLGFVRRRHLNAVRDINASRSMVNMLRGREISGPLSRRWLVAPKLYNSMQFQRRTLGHLSSVYCLLFDHSGKYIITGADDLLIKIWSSRTGRLIATLRGASSEITDITINIQNSLLAAGSIDRVLRVWDLQTGVPVAFLTGHTGMITSVNFCPSPSWNFQYLITTSTDGSVAFWTYSYDKSGKLDFRTKPTVYQEKLRPGQAQMICSSFSPGGTFLATGSADHHVRVYYMKGDEGPHRILETEIHTDRVDSIQWAHSGLRFMSGSKDGNAIIWSFESQQWKTLVFNMSTKLSTSQKEQEQQEQKKIKVTMVAWDLADKYAVTAVSDYTLKVWDSHTGQLYKVLTGHLDEVYVLETHPHDANVILSAGHDGQIFVWDISTGDVLTKYLNTIEHQGDGAIFDVKWSPDGNTIAASDSYGHLLIFGFGKGCKMFDQLPRELFFHTDYRPLVRDQNNHVLDEQTQIPPHLMPPPFLVDVDGNPYPPMIQRLVPGRENCRTEQLVPSVVLGNEGTQEVIQVIPELLVDNRVVDQEEEDRNNANVVFSQRPNARRIRDMHGVRQSTGDWECDPNMKWKKRILVAPLKGNAKKRVNDSVTAMEEAEMVEYRRQLCQRPHMISTSSKINHNEPKNNDRKKKKNGTYQTRYRNSLRYQMVIVSEESEAETENSESTGHSDWAAEDEERPRTRSRRRRVSYNSESDNARDSGDSGEEEEGEEEEDSDEEGDNSRNSRTSRASRGSAREAAKNAREAAKEAARNSREAAKEAARNSREAAREQRKRPERPPARETGVKVNNIAKDVKSVPEAYKTNEWLTEVRPRKTPYFPQVGDEVVYFPQGHHLYIDAVRVKKTYEINTKSLPWTKLQLKDHEFAKVVDIQYEIKPPRVCNLKMALQDEDGRLNGRNVIVKYHDMPDVLDFFVLRQYFEAGMSRSWTEGDKFRCMIDDGWWIGEIVAKNNASEDFQNSPFLCYEIKWDNGELERMSPWDMEPLDENRIPENLGEALPVLEGELQNILYQPGQNDWPNDDRDSASDNIVAGLSKVMELAIAEPFLVPVDLNVYPTYAMIIQYPVDLSTIKARFENRFYRRITAAQFDVRHLAMNAEKFNEKHSVIVKHARILTDLCLRIIKQCSMQIDVSAVYHQLVDAYDDSSEGEMNGDVATPSGSRKLRSLPTRYLRRAGEWKKEARKLFNAVWEGEDSDPFKTPVDRMKYPDYYQIITNPMDLSTVKDKLVNNGYKTPVEFHEDMKLIFSNSRIYNTNERSRIYVMTVRLAGMFEEHVAKIIRNWKTAKRRNTETESPTAANESSSSSSDSEDGSLDVENGSPFKPDSESDSDDDKPLRKLQNQRIPKLPSDYSTSSTSSSTTAFKKLRAKATRKGPVTDSEGVDDDDNDSNYEPSRKRNRATTSSSEEVDNSSNNSDEEPLSSHRVNGRQVNGRAVVKKQKTEASTSSRSRRRISSDESDEEDDDDSDDSDRRRQNGRYFSTVSSRGRVRKLTPRAKALLTRK